MQPICSAGGDVRAKTETVQKQETGSGLHSCIIKDWATESESVAILRHRNTLSESVQQAALIANNGAVIVNVPHPVRYALHKLLIFGEREGSVAERASFDIWPKRGDKKTPE